MVENFRSHTYASQRYKTGGGDGPWRLVVIIIGRSFKNKALIMFECHVISKPNLIQRKVSRKYKKWECF